MTTTREAIVTRTLRGRPAYQIKGEVAMVVATDSDAEALLSSLMGRTVTVEWDGYDHATLASESK